MAERRRGGFGVQVAALASVLTLSQLAPASLLVVSLAGLSSPGPDMLAVGSVRQVAPSPAPEVTSRARGVSRAARLLEPGQAPEAPVRALSIVEAPPALEPPPARDRVPLHGPPPPPPPAVVVAPSPVVAVSPVRVPPPVLQASAAIVAILEAAAAEFGQDEEALLRVAYCESRLNPRAVGPFGEVGILQFFPSTFVKWGKALGYGASDMWDVRAQARVAAHMWANGQKTQWVCR